MFISWTDYCVVFSILQQAQRLINIKKNDHYQSLNIQVLYTVAENVKNKLIIL